MIATAGTFNKQGIRKIASISIPIYFLAYALLPATSRINANLHGALLGLLYVLPIMAGFMASLWAARNTKHYKRLWNAMSVGTFSWLIGGSISAVYSGTLGAANMPSPSIADVFSIAYIPVVLGIMLSLGRIKPPFDAEKKQFLTNAAMLALAMFLLCYKFLLIPAWFSNPVTGL